MGLFGNLLELATDIVVTPIAIAKDVVTLGGSITDEEPATLKKLEDISDDLQNIIDNYE